jgi:hypothetical protein
MAILMGGEANRHSVRIHPDLAQGLLGVMADLFAATSVYESHSQWY